MQPSLQSNLQKIAERKVIKITDYEKVDIVASEYTVTQIKKICKKTGLSVSQVVEGIIRTALEDKSFVSISQNN